MSAVRDSLIRTAAEAAGRAAELLNSGRCEAGVSVSMEAGDELPGFLEWIEAPVEFALLPRRMEMTPEEWRPVFLPLSILQAEGRVAVRRGAGRQEWEVSLSLFERLQVRMGGGALGAARKMLAETGEQAMWWLPAQLSLMAAGEPAPEGLRERWDALRRTHADLSRQDRALAVVALGGDAPLPFEFGDAGELTERQGAEGNWRLAQFSGQILSTAFALEALRHQGVDDREAAVLRAGEWLRSVQNADGGWGESAERAAGEAPSSAVRTACAVAGLVAGGDAGSESVRRGIDYLVRTQTQDGKWQDDGNNWMLLPGYVECRSSLDQLTLPLMALTAFLKHTGAEFTAGSLGIEL